MTEIRVDVTGLEQQLAALALPDGEALEILSRLARVMVPSARVGNGGPPRPPSPGPEAEDRSTAQRLAAQVQQSEVRFRSLVEQLPAVVFYAALGDDDNEVYISPQIEALLGFTQREWLTNPLLWYSQLHPDDHDAVIEAFTQGVQTGDPFRAEVRFWSRDGHEVWILGEAHLIRDHDGRLTHFQGVAFDITPTKRAQAVMAEAQRATAEAAQIRANAYAASNVKLTELNDELRVARDRAETAARARTTFLTTMSHELRTPLNSVVVLSGLLADSELTPAQHDMVRRMQLSSDHLLELINDVLEFSRLRAGQVELDRRRFDLASWLADTIDIVAPKAVAKGLDLQYRIAEGVPAMLVTDEGRLRQVLLNLLANAVKFTAEGSVAVHVTARPSEPLFPSSSAPAFRPWEFTCSVSDSGVGIRAAEAETLFSEFRQADSGIAREFGGTGLGLAICKRLCELLGGRIWVDDPGTGPGATFIFTWVAEAADMTMPPLSRPVAPPTEVVRDRPRFAPLRRALRRTAHPWARPSVASVPPGDAAAVRILLVDDDIMNQQVAILLLGAMGHRPDVVGSGDEAVAAVIARPYDIVLMDVAMPATDGLSATRSIRRLGDGVHQPYIVALTANALPGDAEVCIEAGMDDYLAKPIDRRELTRALAAGANGPLAPRPTTPRGEVPGDDGFDPSVPLELLHQFGPEPLRRVLALFGSQSPKLAAAASAAVAAGNVDDAGRAAHTLKSSAASVGAPGLAAACAELEALARTGSLDGAEDLVAAVDTRLDAALRHLVAFEASYAPD